MTVGLFTEVCGCCGRTVSRAGTELLVDAESGAFVPVCRGCIESSPEVAL